MARWAARGSRRRQAAIFSRYARYGVPLQEAVTARAGCSGETWGERATSLKLEDRFAPDVIDALRAPGMTSNCWRLHLDDGPCRRDRPSPRRPVRGRDRPAQRRDGGGMVKHGARAVARCDELGVAPYSAEPDMLFRAYLTPAHAAAQEAIAGWMIEAGMTVRIDPAANLIGRYEGTDPDAPALIIGSISTASATAAAMTGRSG
jgi:hypothetical protein